MTEEQACYEDIDDKAGQHCNIVHAAHVCFGVKGKPVPDIKAGHAVQGKEYKQTHRQLDTDSPMGGD